MDNINKNINVEFYHLLNEITPGFVAITVLELLAKISQKILKNWENMVVFSELELILTTLPGYWEKFFHLFYSVNNVPLVKYKDNINSRFNVDLSNETNPTFIAITV